MVPRADVLQLKKKKKSISWEKGGGFPPTSGKGTWNKPNSAHVSQIPILKLLNQDRLQLLWGNPVKNEKPLSKIHNITSH